LDAARVEGKEHLDVGELKGGMATLSARVTSIDQTFAPVHTDLALLSERMDHLEARMDSIEVRLERIEKRLDPN
jgi:hypothetical protein